MPDPFGYGTNLLGVTTRPSGDPRVLTAQDTFSVDCSSSTANDGTQASAEQSNEVTANLRALLRVNGNLATGLPVVPENNQDGALASAAISLVQRGAVVSATDTGSANAMAVTISPAPPEFVNGMVIRVRKGAAANGTGEVFLSVNSTTNLPILWADNGALQQNDWPAAAWGLLAYDAIAETPTWKLLAPPSMAPFSRVLPQASLVHFGADAGTANGLAVATVNPPVTAVTAGMLFYVVKSALANTGAMNATIAGRFGPVIWGDGSALDGGDWGASAVAGLLFDGANYRVVTPMGPTVFARAQQVIVASYDAAGSYTFTAPESGWYFVECSGAGGGGAGGGASATWSSGGGGSGGYTSGYYFFTGGQQISLIIGAGGAGGNNGNGARGADGGTTSFSTIMQALGGGGGQGGTAGSGGGSSGLGFGSQVNISGAPGGDGNPFNSQIQGGVGASSRFGGGGRTSTVGHGSSTAADAAAPGAGGGGIWNTGGAAQIGGYGADGIINITR